MAINKWMQKLESDFGVVASKMKKNILPPIPSWSPSLNWSTGIGGFQPGKITCLYGAESSGKSMISAMALIELQRRDPEALAIWFDTEFSFNPTYFQQLGGDLDRLVVRQTNDPTTIFDYIGGELQEQLQDGMPVKAIVLDSVRAIRYPKDVKKSTTDFIVGGTGANYLPSALKLIIPVIAKFNILTFFVQQVSIQLDQMKALRNPYVLPDGQSLKHACDLMLEVIKLDSKAGIVESGETISGAVAQIGHKIRVKVKKNRMGVPARMAQFTLGYGVGVIDVANEIVDLAKSLNVMYHPVNPETGKENNQMWQFGKYDPIRGEANMRVWVAASKKVQDEIMVACNSHKDARVELNVDGTVKDPDEDLTVDL